MPNQLDFLAIGDITTDAFIRLKDAHISCSIDKENCELCMRFADKIPYEFVEVVRAVGNAPNAAVSAARLGLSSGVVTDIGDDENGCECVEVLKKEKVDTNYITTHKGGKTNYHYVLWFEVERTILVKHEEYEYKLPAIEPSPRWIYLSSLGGNSEDYHYELAHYLEKHPEVKLAFQPGTFQMKLGKEKLKRLYARSSLFFCNKEEAQRILASSIPPSTKEVPESSRAEDLSPLIKGVPPSSEVGVVKIPPRKAVLPLAKGESDVKTLLAGIHALGPKIVCITDGPKGAYAFDGDMNEYWFQPIYPDPKPPMSRTGAGDAFASTFTSAIILGKKVEEALKWAPINSAYVVQQIGAQKGLLTREQLEKLLADAPADYRPQEI